MPDDATVEILIKARNTAEAQIAEAQGGLDLLRRAVEKFAQAETDGMTATFAMREALKSLRDQLAEAGVSAEGQKVAINQARNAMLEYNAAVAGGLPWDAALSASLAEQTGQFEANAAATETDAVAQRSFGAALLANVAAILPGLLAFTALTAAIGAGAAALFPFVASLVAGTTIAIAFGVAATGMAVALAGATGMFLTIGGAIVLLTDKMGWINNSMARFKDHLHGVAENLAKLASPAANKIVGFLDSLLPLAQGAGRDIIEWFNARLPLALASMHSAINNLSPDIKSFAQFLGAMFDKLSPQIPTMFEEIARFGIGALQGLIGNLVNLGQWFQSRLPSYGPVIKDIFGGIGNAVQGLATNFGKLSDWFVKNWPSIKGNLDAFTSGFKDGFDAINKAFGGAGSVDWKGFFHGLGVAIGGAAGAISDFARAFGIVFSQVVAALPTAWQNITNGFIGMVNQFIGGINGMLSAINSLPGPVKALLGISGNLGMIGLLQLPGLGGTTATQSGRAGGNQSLGDNGNVGKPGSTRPAAPNVTIHVSGATSPQVTSATIARNLRKLGVA